MSFQPPQPPQQPPSWSTPPTGAPPAGGPPPFGAPPVPASPAPGRAHKPRMIAPAMIVAALVLLAVAVGVVLVARGGGDGLDGEGASEGFDALADDAEYDDGGFFELRRCPLGDQDDLNERVAGTLDLPDELVDGDAYEYMTERDGDLPEGVWCGVSADSGGDEVSDSILYTASRLPRDDYDAFLVDSFPGGNVEVGDPQEHRGGTIYPYCFAPDDGTAGCGADWVDEEHDIAIGLNYSTDTDDADAAVDAVEELLPDMVDALAEQR